MAARSMKVRGRSVSSETNKETSEVTISIDGRTIEATYDAVRKSYSTTAMPYQDYGSVKQLAEALIANHPDFRDPRPES